MTPSLCGLCVCVPCLCCLPQCIQFIITDNAVEKTAGTAEFQNVPTQPVAPKRPVIRRGCCGLESYEDDQEFAFGGDLVFAAELATKMGGRLTQYLQGNENYFHLILPMLPVDTRDDGFGEPEFTVRHGLCMPVDPVPNLIVADHVFEDDGEELESAPRYSSGTDTNMEALADMLVVHGNGGDVDVPNALVESTHAPPSADLPVIINVEPGAWECCACGLHLRPHAHAACSRPV